jgi:hypothetical protein
MRISNTSLLYIAKNIIFYFFIFFYLFNKRIAIPILKILLIFAGYNY